MAHDIKILTLEEKHATYGTGAIPTIAQSLDHAAMIYATGCVDDTNGGEVAQILDTLSQHLPTILHHLEAYHTALSYHLEDGGIESLNYATYSPAPSFESDETEKAREYVQEIQDLIGMLTPQAK